MRRKKLAKFFIFISILVAISFIIYDANVFHAITFLPRDVAREFLSSRLEVDSSHTLLFTQAIHWRSNEHLNEEGTIQPEDLFLQIVSFFGVQLILLEPRVLLSNFQHRLRSYSDSEYLKSFKNQFLLQSSSLKNYITTFGLKKQSLSLFLSEKEGSLQAKLLEAGFTIQMDGGRVEDRNSSQLSKQAHQLFFGPNHLFFTHTKRTRRVLIHIVVLERHRGFRHLWITGVSSDALSEPFTTDLLILRGKESLLDDFMSVQMTVDSSVLLSAPANLYCFLQNLKVSSFVPCNRSLSRAFEKLPHQQNVSKTINNISPYVILNVLRELKAIFQPLGVPLWLCCGTLLGWYRQCGVVPYADDIDFWAWSRDIPKLLLHEETLERGISASGVNQNVKLCRIFGLPHKGYQYVFAFGNINVDVFFMYEEKDHMWDVTHLDKNHYLVHKYPKIELCSSVFYTEKVLVPCDPVEVLETLYGPRWDLPVQNWKFNSSPHNICERLSWSPEEQERINGRQIHCNLPIKCG